MTSQTKDSGGISGFISRTSGNEKLDWADILTYLYMFFGTLLMFGPVLWIVLSSFKTEAELSKFPPRVLPYRQETVEIEDTERLLFEVLMEDGSVETLARLRTIGKQAQMVDPANPEEPFNVDNTALTPIENIEFSLDNYSEGIQSFNFARYFVNSVTVTLSATLLTLLVNSMAAFSLSKYQYRGRNVIFLVIISTLMVPISVILVPAFLLITQIGWNNNLLGVIVPGAATPTGVFLLRQYMLTIPDELLDSARIDGASEWRIYAQIILPLSTPALAVLAIFSIMWRWNDFLWPKIVLTQSEYFTLQVGLESFQGFLDIQWDLILAMTVVTIIPITIVFAFLQKYITTGIATTGMK